MISHLAIHGQGWLSIIIFFWGGGEQWTKMDMWPSFRHGFKHQTHEGFFVGKLQIYNVMWRGNKHYALKITPKKKVLTSHIRRSRWPHYDTRQTLDVQKPQPICFLLQLVDGLVRHPVPTIGV